MAEQSSLQLEREKRLLSETLIEIALALTSHTRHKDVLDEILTQAKRLVPYQTAHFLLLEDDSLRIAHWQGYENTGSENHISTLVQPLTNFPFDQQVIRSKTARVLSDTHQEPNWIITPETSWVRSHLVLPIYLHNQVLGILRLDSNLAGQFTLKDIEKLQPLANIAAIALKNAQLYDQFRRELKERRRTEAALRISEEFGQTKGLNLIPGQVRYFKGVLEAGAKIPHTGWNSIVEARQGSSMENTVGDDFYFIHSLYAQTDDPAHTIARCTYHNVTFAAAIERDNIIGFQFHPERSGESGLALYKNIIRKAS